jgi:hypothetical protein
MFEIDWLETALKDLQAGVHIDDVVESYYQLVQEPSRTQEDVRVLVEGIQKNISADLPPYLVMSAPDIGGLTPDDLGIQPAWTDLEIERLFGMHDGRSYGTMIVAVYKLNREGPLPVYDRDMRWGMLGDERKTRPANPDDPTDFIGGGSE